ncbi:MAG: hypothetical protein ACE5LB_09570 [Acidiferrobacterales bacterium]
MLETLLARSDRMRGNRRPDLESLVFDLFNISITGDGDLPVAAVTRVLDLGVIDNGWWLRADPVHLRPDRDRLLLADAAMLNMKQEEADQLVSEVMDVYADDGWILKPGRPDRWYLKPPSIPEIHTAPLPAVVGCNIHDYLPRGKDGTTWRTILNEIQILLHTTQVNSEREQRAELPINSLWFWGGGQLPDPQPVAWNKVWSGEPVSLALARLAQTPTAAVPANAEEWFKLAGGGEHLVVLDAARSYAHYGDVESWHTFVQGLEALWIAPLLSAVKHGVLQGVTIYTESSPGFLYTGRCMRRWWRRRRALSAYR